MNPATSQKLSRDAIYHELADAITRWHSNSALAAIAEQRHTKI